jgi:hypothetical protein
MVAEGQAVAMEALMVVVPAVVLIPKPRINLSVVTQQYGSE